LAAWELRGWNYLRTRGDCPDADRGRNDGNYPTLRANEDGPVPSAAPRGPQR
jgi:hypothetical protein